MAGRVAYQCRRYQRTSRARPLVVHQVMAAHIGIRTIGVRTLSIESGQPFALDHVDHRHDTHRPSATAAGTASNSDAARVCAARRRRTIRAGSRTAGSSRPTGTGPDGGSGTWRVIDGNHRPRPNTAYTSTASRTCGTISPGSTCRSFVTVRAKRRRGGRDLHQRGDPQHVRRRADVHVAGRQDGGAGEQADEFAAVTRSPTPRQGHDRRATWFGSMEQSRQCCSAGPSGANDPQPAQLRHTQPVRVVIRAASTTLGITAPSMRSSGRRLPAWSGSESWSRTTRSTR